VVTPARRSALTYDLIGAGYAARRRPDPRIEGRLHTALGDARSVINVGAGTGSYEPVQTMLAVEPSAVMVEQRPAGAAPVVRARAEALPVASGAADAAMAVLTVHHWSDVPAGIAELRRVARRRVVVLTCDPSTFSRFWLVREYLPELAAADPTRQVPLVGLAELLGGARIEPVPVPHDCTDGFAAAYWRRPHAYLDPAVRAGVSLLARAPRELLQPALRRLADDLAAGRWHARHRDLAHREELDAGYRLLIAEQSGAT
jgi:SAM-dependent methyltransferase